MLIRREEDDNVDVQLTSFMDISFLLLIFFLVTASLRKPHKELSIDLPDSGAAKIAKAPKEELIISIDREGKIFLGNEGNITNQELSKRLQHISNTAPQTRIRLDVDRQGKVFHMVRIMDMCHLYNLKTIGVRTKD